MSPFAGKFIEFSEEEFAGSIGIKEFIKRLSIAFKALVKAASRNEVEKVVDLSEGITLKCSYKNGKYTYTFTDEKGREKTFEDHIPQDFNFIEWAHGIPSKTTTHSEEEDFADNSKANNDKIKKLLFERNMLKNDLKDVGREGGNTHPIQREIDEINKVLEKLGYKEFADEEVEEDFSAKLVIKNSDLKDKFYNKFIYIMRNQTNTKHPKFKKFKEFLENVNKLDEIDDAIAKKLIENVEMSEDVCPKCGHSECRCSKSPFGMKRFISKAKREQEDEFAGTDYFNLVYSACGSAMVAGFIAHMCRKYPQCEKLVKDTFSDAKKLTKESIEKLIKKLEDMVKTKR